ncbi:basic salivary proline-rich protein 1-like [Dama dama]|uniref:basic salivary proline-rich protein 1-like n=1 Tax=Dama dama TaxID=30532 RepID=UPI002A369B1C|nr:basic salivary proline-rich protein 1-like [Dama dama]
MTDGLLFPDSCVEEARSRQPSLSRAGILPPRPGAGVSARAEEDGTRPGVPPAPTVRAGGEPLLAEPGPWRCPRGQACRQEHFSKPAPPPAQPQRLRSPGHSAPRDGGGCCPHGPAKSPPPTQDQHPGLGSGFRSGPSTSHHLWPRRAPGGRECGRTQGAESAPQGQPQWGRVPECPDQASPHGQTLEKPWGTHTPRRPPCAAHGSQPDRGPDPALGVLPVGSAWVGLAGEAPRHPDGQAMWPLASSRRAAAGSMEAAQGPGTCPEPAPSDPRACLLSAPSRPRRWAEAATRSTCLLGGLQARGPGREERRSTSKSPAQPGSQSRGRRMSACLRLGGCPGPVLPKLAEDAPSQNPPPNTTGRSSEDSVGADAFIQTVKRGPSTRLWPSQPQGRHPERSLRPPGSRLRGSQALKPWKVSTPQGS